MLKKIDTLVVSIVWFISYETILNLNESHLLVVNYMIKVNYLILSNIEYGKSD